MIQFRNLTLARGARRLIIDASMQIHPGWRVGVVGANGSGKSSLFSLLREGLHTDAGDYSIPAHWTIASVAQETPALATTALDYVLDGDAELRQIERRLIEAEHAHDGHMIGELHGRLSEIDGYSAPSRAATLLHGLGFSDADFTRPVSDFSGGWRMRLNLAQALMCRSDLLLLDEPTNHLDLDAVVWLEKWLSSYRGTMLLVSHDRDFLDGTVTHIAHLYDQRLTLYTGNYSSFEDQRASQLAVQQAMFDKQQREVAHLTKYIDRFRAQATKARQAQSRIKALARMEKMSAAHVDAPFDFMFPEPARAPDPLLALDNVCLGYDDTLIIDTLKLDLRPGARIGLLGPNGAGKSTLIKHLAGELAPLTGVRTEGKGLIVGYFAQHQLEQLRPDESPLQHLQRMEPRVRMQDHRDYLGSFDFRGAMADAPIAPLSGGEKSRLALALLVRCRPNLLLLDEPTNHLDLEMRHALTKALAEYEGSMVLVSHDRTLLRMTCNDFILVADGKAQPFDGDLDDYLVWLTERNNVKNTARNTALKDARKEPAVATTAPQPKPPANQRALLKELEQLEKKMQQWTAEKNTVETQLADPAIYDSANSGALQTALKKQADLSKRLEQAEERWLEIQAGLEG